MQGLNEKKMGHTGETGTGREACMLSLQFSFFFLISAHVIGNIYDFWNIFILERESVCVLYVCVAA